eukprot:2660524-Alexandrium_andersonii.AAC.1
MEREPPFGSNPPRKWLSFSMSKAWLPSCRRDLKRPPPCASGRATKLARAGRQLVLSSAHRPLIRYSLLT